MSTYEISEQESFGLIEVLCCPVNEEQGIYEMSTPCNVITIYLSWDADALPLVSGCKFKVRGNGYSGDIYGDRDLPEQHRGYAEMEHKLMMAVYQNQSLLLDLIIKGDLFIPLSLVTDDVPATLVDPLLSSVS